MKVIVMGGDTRQIYCAGRLSLERGLDVSALWLGSEDSQPVVADVLVLPYVSVSSGCLNAPLVHEKIPIETVYKAIGKGTAVFGGMLPDDIVDTIKKLGADYYDWFSFEELTLKNARLTAEGAAQIIVRNSDSAVSGSRIMILGWGRVAKACAELFSAMGAEVTVSARSGYALEDAASKGFKTAEFIDMDAVGCAQVIVNTVPYRVLTREHLERADKHTLILELASKPYGLDLDMAVSMGLKAILGSGLPGRYTPESSGRYMAQTVIDVLKEREAK